MNMARRLSTSKPNHSRRGQSVSISMGVKAIKGDDDGGDDVDDDQDDNDNGQGDDYDDEDE